MKYDLDAIATHVCELLKDKECDTVEFKSALGGFTESFWETYSAFANTQGGVIILGIKEYHNEFEPNNLSDTDIDKLLKNFWSGVRNKNTINVCLLQQKDVEVGFIGESKVILFQIPAARRELRPIHCTLDAFSGTYRRNHEGDYLCSQMEVRRMFADADVFRPSDGRILKNYSWEDIDMPSFEQYRRLFALAKSSHAWLSLSNKDLMQRLGGYRRDRDTGEEGFTVAGLLMFGKYDAIRDESCVPRFFPDYKEIPSDTTSEGWIDSVYPDCTWEANLFQFYRRVLPKLHEVIPTPFRLENSQRRDETLAHESLREAFANLCVHADYSEESSLLIYRYPNYILFSNPGTMLVTRSQFYSGGESVCRNNNLQTMFMMLGSADKAGSGVDKILKGWDANDWIRPYISERSQPNKVELLMPLESLVDKRILQELQTRFGSKLNNLNKDERMVLALALTENKVNNERLRYTLAMHPADITHILQRLTKLEFLVSYGYGRGMVYQLNEVTNDETLQGNVNTLQDNSVKTLQGNVKTLQDKGEIFQISVKTLQGNVKTLQDDNGDRWKASKKDNSLMPKRMSRKDMMEKIISFCSEWRTAEEISIYLQRKKRYISNEILPNMTSLLERKYPQVKHPDQKYRSKSLGEKSIYKSNQ